MNIWKRTVMGKAVNLSKRCNDFAIYLPAIQKGFAKATLNLGDKNRAFPANLTMRDLNFLNPNNKLWHYKYALYSAGQLSIGEQQADIITNRNIDETVILGDSGGYQIGKGTLGGFNKHGNLRNANDICDAWTNAVELKQWILDWLETNSDYAMTIDMPLWSKFEDNKNTPFHKCSTEQLINLTVENLRFIQNNKRGNTKWLNVIQGTTYDDTKLWWDAVKGFRFDGWAMAGNAGYNGGVAAIIKQVLTMRDEGAFDVGMDWLHVLGVSQTKWAVLLTAIQRGLRDYCNPSLRVSFDSASPTLISGRYEQIVLKPNFTSDENSWAFSMDDCPINKKYVNATSSPKFPYTSPLADLLEMHHLNANYDKYKGVTLDSTSHHLLTNHNTWVYITAMIEANELAFGNMHNANKYVPSKILDCINIFEDMLTTKNWLPIWKKHIELFNDIKKMKES